MENRRPNLSGVKIILVLLLILSGTNILERMSRYVTTEYIGQYVEYGVQTLMFHIILSVSVILVASAVLTYYSSWDIIHSKKIKRGVFARIVPVLLLMIVVSTSLVFIADYVGVDVSINQDVSSGYNTDYYPIIFIIVQFLLIVPAEELLFRGISQGILRSRYSVSVAVVVSSVVFGLSHLDAGNVAYAVSTIAGGVIFGYLYEITEDISIPIIVHGLFNAWIVILAQYLHLI